MKKIITLLLCAFPGLVAFAQPQLNSMNIQAGDEYDLYNITNIVPSSLAHAGANQTWSITAGTSTLAGSALFIDPSTTPYGATYPVANLALRVILNGDTVYHLFKNSSTDGLEEVATDLGTGSSPDIFTTFRTLLPPTYDYTDSMADSYQKQSQVASTAYVRYDAWGGLTTSDSAYTNLGRIYRNDTQGNTNVIWWSLNGRSPVLLYDGSVLIYWKKKSTPTGINKAVNRNQLTIYPNPAGNVLTIQTKLEIDNIEIMDINGRPVLKTNGAGKVDVSALPGGLYLVKVMSKNEVSISRFQKL